MKASAFGCILTLILAILGGVLGRAWYFRFDYDPGDTWKSLAMPPAKAVHLLAVDWSTIYIQTVDQKIYSCDSESPRDQACWNEVESIPEEILQRRTIPFPTETPLLLENVIERRAYFESGPGMAHNYTELYAYILLSDGTVMQWAESDAKGIVNSTIFLFRVGLGLCIGSLIYPVFSLFWRWSRKSPRLRQYG